MFFSEDIRQEMPYGLDNDIDINITNQNVNSNMNSQEMMGGMSMGGCCSSQTMQNPVVEPMKERCVYRNIVHEVPHVCPINTRIINNHIYKHTYQPRYTCCEENIVTNQQCGSCCDFR